MNNLQHKSKGFTLIELIIVIVILGILSVIAAPRFIDITSDANAATMQSMASAMESANQLVYAKALIQGLQNEADTDIDLDGDGVSDVNLNYGYVSASRSNGLSKVLDESLATDWTWSTTFGDTDFRLTTASIGGRIGQYVNSSHINGSECYIIYEPSTGVGQKPSIAIMPNLDCN